MLKNHEQDSQKLIEFLLSEVSYRECHKDCGWSEWCPYSKEMTQCDRQCGFVVKFANDLATSQKQLISTLNPEDKYEYENALVAFIRFIDRFLERFTHLQIDGILESYQQYAAHTFSRGFINCLKTDLKEADLLISKSTRANSIAFLVEGQSEKEFINHYQNFFLGELIYSYNGSGNLNKLHILIDFFLENGHSVFVQFDLDKKHNKKTQLDSLKKKYSGKDVYFFAFNDCLEESYPLNLVNEALKYMGIDLCFIVKDLTYKELFKNYGINIDDVKINLAKIIGKLIYHIGRRDKDIDGEIFKFADFIDSARYESQKDSKYWEHINQETHV